MTEDIQELLKPRRKVIAGWFQSNINPFHVGDILIKNGIHFTRIGNPKSIHENEVDLYPHLIKPLEWWQDREEKDMPEYVKCGQDYRRCRIFGIYYLGDKETGINPDLRYFLPATKEEYLNQNK